VLFSRHSFTSSYVGFVGTTVLSAGLPHVDMGKPVQAERACISRLVMALPQARYILLQACLSCKATTTTVLTRQPFHTHSLTKDSMLAGVGLFSCAFLAVLRHTLSMYFITESWYGEWSNLRSRPHELDGMSSLASFLHVHGAWWMGIVHT
jgi:hypothetical protein